jgi:UDP-N-acetylmuramate dehydrogenase
MLLQENIPLQNKNTYRIGGAARWYTEPCDKVSIIDSIHFASDKGVPLFVMGKGSNVVISDSGWPGLVINLSVGYGHIEWRGTEAICESGALLNTLAYESAGKGLEGMERLSGIPGTIGGAVMMNAGAFDSCIADTIREASWIELGNDREESASREKLGLGYRTSIFQRTSAVILSARFSFAKAGEEGKLIDIREDILRRRKEKQPLEFPNCGSVFKRPAGDFAGRFIEQCGLKGYRCGDAEVSEKHANFIVNHGKATARDVRKVMYTVQKKVYDSFGVLLEPEVVFIGDFEEPLFSIQRSESSSQQSE